MLPAVQDKVPAIVADVPNVSSFVVILISPLVMVKVVGNVLENGSVTTFPAPKATVKLVGPFKTGNSIALAVTKPGKSYVKVELTAL